ncbi:3-deoxy-8-phosphooctulonate synthase [Tichowtungia aerotolerans]|uniref:2-dehydro-3-deoxyphosphooctonate aldolase n=1 Tax=Tichowtungia aerotolerans TaxID=2697043 RepID=A0A6P1M883_9BACT|nr:3-deoxy-8-phosphooctulonate synthase [Tichowtungia aerotolerans]QHI70252.1 3-deoxy-8-phosphooctulonate synthase [Tichowtungia aerotolerans]
MTKTINVKGVKFGGRSPLALIAGPCVIESREGCMAIADKLVKLSKKQNIPLVFKASYDKANRTSINSYRGPGIAKGLEILSEIKEKYNVPVLTDVHSVEEIHIASKVVDIIQLPAFLIRQTDIVVAAGESGAVVNVKKAQFAAPWDMAQVVKKIESTGNTKIMLTERGASFGYNTLVADMRSLIIMRELGYPVIFDATHSVQSPGGKGDSSGGDGRFAPYLAKAAAAVGVDGMFIETHPDPENALSDGPNMIPTKDLSRLWKKLSAIDEVK